MTQYESILQHRRRLDAIRADQKTWTPGVRVRVRTDLYMTDYGGAVFYGREVGTVTRITRSTVDVVDPRGHIHRGRPKGHYMRAKARR